MFIETTDQKHRQKVYIRADRVCGVRDWPSGERDAPTVAEVFLLGGPQTLMVGEPASALMERITGTLGA